MKKTKKWKRILTVLCIFTMIAGIMSPSAIYAGDSAEESASAQAGISEADQTENEDTGASETDVLGDAGLSSGNENSQSAADITGSDNTVISASDSANDAEEEAASEPAEPSGTTADSGTVETSAESYPAVSMSVKADDGTEIQISAPEGAFPSGIQVTVTKVDSDQILSALKEASNNDALTTDQVMAYDFDFHLASGEHNIEPEKEISVQFSLPEMKAEDSVSAYHLKDENSSAEKEDITADSSAGTATLETQQFSIHAFLVGTAENTSGITIDYNESTEIHSVDGTKIILYCMNNELHWPHRTPSITNVPTYTETSFEEFFNANGITGDAQKTLKTNLENLLYAGYPYNGYGLYEIVDSSPTISEADFNKLLTPPDYLRQDFPDSLGNNTFTYADRNDTMKKKLLQDFLIEVGYLFPDSPDRTTKSGLSYNELMQLPFIRAATIMAYYDGDPITNYSQAYITDHYVTESQAYAGTRDAIWTLLKGAGLDDNGTDVNVTKLVDNLLKADTTNLILTELPSEKKVSISGDPTFYYSTGDHKWHTDPLSLKVPKTYNTYFKLNLPDGVTEETGKTQVKGGESFSLVSSTKPENNMSISLSSTIPWMDSDLKVYVADSTVKASDGKGFQNMIGAVIHQTKITKTVNLSSTDKSLTFTKVWKDNGNKDNVRPDPETYKNKLHLMNGNTELTGFQPEIADKGDNSWTITYNGLPAKIDGKDAAFTVSEGSVDKYTADKESVKDDNETITNTYTPVTISGTKTWNNSGYNSVKKPDSITVNLLANGTVKDSKSVTADKNGQWEYSFDNLPKYDDNGQEIEYTITENNVTDYSTTINGYNITNTYTPGKTSVTVKKEWEDNNNQDGKRPKNVKVQLWANGEKQGEAVDLSADNGWTYTWDKLDEKDKSLKDITYSVDEVDVPAGYTSQISDGSKQHYFVITNTHQPETTKIKV